MQSKFPRTSAMDLLVYSSDIQNLTEIIRNRLYFAVLKPNVELKNTTDTFFFNTDDEYVYVNYYYDFGPLNIACLYKYCCKVNELLHSGSYKRIVHCTANIPQNKSNAAFLIGCFGVVCLRVNPRQIIRALVSGCVHFMPFTDASQGGSEWKITLIDCFSAIQKAHSLHFFDFNDFHLTEYEMYDKLQNGDLNWLLPRKFLAFIGPTDLELMNYHSPEFYIQYFVNNDVKAVIRLNNVTYNPTVFTTVGIDHYDLFFPDGSTPPKHILLEFLKICERTPGPIAVHCKAGLGRTGSLIGAYIVKHYRMSAREAIAWLRMCRPGSVIGPQQGWLEHMESWLWRQGNHYRFENFGDCDKFPPHKYGIYSIEWAREHAKLVRMAKQKELQLCQAGAVKRPQKPSKNEFEKYSNPKSSVLSGRSHDSRSGATQGDKLNFIKAYKQYNVSVPIPCMHERFAESLKLKHRSGGRNKKMFVETNKKI